MRDGMHGERQGLVLAIVVGVPGVEGTGASAGNCEAARGIAQELGSLPPPDQRHSASRGWSGHGRTSPAVVSLHAHRPDSSLRTRRATRMVRSSDDCRTGAVPGRPRERPELDGSRGFSGVGSSSFVGVLRPRRLCPGGWPRRRDAEAEGRGPAASLAGAPPRAAQPIAGSRRVWRRHPCPGHAVRPGWRQPAGGRRFGACGGP
jgi:hypothetical protein